MRRGRSEWLIRASRASRSCTHQGRPLVGREATRKADEQGVLIQGAAQRGDDLGGLSPTLGLGRRQPPHGRDELGLCLPASGPQGVLVDGVRIREATISSVEPPLDAARVVDRIERRRQPGRQVHAVRDVADRHLRDFAVGEEFVPHLTTDFAVQLRDAVGRDANP